MEEQIKTAPQTDVEVVDIQFRSGQKIYFFDPDGQRFADGDHIIIDTARGEEFGICVGGNHKIPPKNVVAPLRKVLRRATPQDEKTIQENRAKEKRAFEVCQQKIAEHGLDMQLVNAEVAFDGSKILFYFTADERVDFRELVKNLASVFRTRIELRQIGVRDKARMVGGLGICGRPFCCASFLDDFQPVSIKMAKTQNLSLNPTKISGTCGRLMCCLKYEQDAYEDLIRNSPRMDSFVDTPEGRGTVVEVGLLRQRVKVRMEDNPETVSTFSNEDIAVLRSGKARKHDPPIPADLAPISGSGKRVRREQAEEKPLLEPIRFRYSTEKIVDDPEEEKPEAAETPEPDDSVADYTAKIIYTASVSIETTEFDKAVAALESQVQKIGGFVESSNVTDDTQYNSDGTTSIVNRWAYYTVRIPCEQFEAFLHETEGFGNGISTSRDAQNVTSAYTDYEARLSSLNTQEERLLDMLAKSEDVETLIALEQRLSDVRYEIESIERSLRNYDMQIRYSTVDLDLREVEVYTPTVPVRRTFGQKLSDSLSDGWTGFARGMQNVILGLASALPALVLLAVIVIVVIVLVKNARKKRRAKFTAQQEPPQDPKP